MKVPTLDASLLLDQLVTDSETVKVAPPSDDPPFGYTEEGGVPVFRPSMEEFKDFARFIGLIEPWGMEKGIVKVIPPAEWVASLPKLDSHVKSIKIKNPIVQHINGSGGLYKVQNIEKQRTFTLPEWKWTCGDEEHQPPAKRGERRRTNKGPFRRAGRANKPKLEGEADEDDHFKDFDYNLNTDEFTPERCAELERQYWKSLTYSQAMYGADMPGSLFDEETDTWNVAHLDNILNRLRVSIPGVNTAYLYCGMWKATFAWHLEDMDLFSINYIHFGAPKQWYSISQKDHRKFYDLMKDMWPEESLHCKEFLRHKTFHASPTLLAQKGITVNRIVHNQHEFMITFPYGYHSGFNFGYNVAESVNFATESWIPYGRQSAKCQCISDSVGINVDQLVRHMNLDFTDSENETADEEEALITGLPTPPYAPADEVTTASKKKKTKSSSRPKEKREAVALSDAEEAKKKKHKKVLGECCLCPHVYDENYVLSGEGTQQAHRVCATYIPETKVLSAVFGARDILVGVARVPKSRWDLKCLECGVAFGTCFQCSYPTCTRAYHGSCAASAGVLALVGSSSDLHVAAGHDNKVELYCRFHRPKRLSIERLETDRATMDWAYTLLPGDVVQCQLESGSIFAGIVDENVLDEHMVVVRALPEGTERIEVAWKWVRTPFGRENSGLWMGFGAKEDEAATKTKQPKSLVPSAENKSMVPLLKSVPLHTAPVMLPLYFPPTGIMPNNSPPMMPYVPTTGHAPDEFGAMMTGVFPSSPLHASSSPMMAPAVSPFAVTPTPSPCFSSFGSRTVSPMKRRFSFAGERVQLVGDPQITVVVDEAANSTDSCRGWVTEVAPASALPVMTNAEMNCLEYVPNKSTTVMDHYREYADIY